MPNKIEALNAQIERTVVTPGGVEITVPEGYVYITDGFGAQDVSHSPPYGRLLEAESLIIYPCETPRPYDTIAFANDYALTTDIPEEPATTADEDVPIAVPGNPRIGELPLYCYACDSQYVNFDVGDVEPDTALQTSNPDRPLQTE